MSQLIKARKLKQFLHQPAGQTNQIGAGYQRDVASWPPLGTINVIFTTLRCNARSCSGVMSMASRSELKEKTRESKRVRLESSPTLGFSKEDKVGTLQTHDDALVVTLRIRKYDVKRVLVD